MRSGNSEQEADVQDPLGILPGVKTEEVGPFGVPVPTPVFEEDVELPEDEVDGDGTTPNGEGSTDQPQPTEADRGISGDGDPSDLRAAAELGDEYIDRVEDAMGEETCDLCLQILEALRDRPIEEQVQGVRELAELKDAAERGLDPTEIAEVMEDFEVVDDPSNML